MKNIKIFGANEVDVQDDYRTRSKHVHAKGSESMDASDGFHTFTELYDHRIALFIALCRKCKDIDLEGSMEYEHEVWRSKLHSDGSSFEGWFVMGLFKKKGEQVTYHLPISEWENTDFAETLEKAPEFDGHSSADVIARVKSL